MEFTPGWEVIRRYYRLILLMTVAAGLTALAIAFISAPVFTAGAAVLVRVGETRLFNVEPLSASTLQAFPPKTIMDTNSVFFNTRALAEEVVRRLQLDQPGPPRGFFAELKSSFQKVRDNAMSLARYGYYKEATPHEAAVLKVQRGLTPVAVRESYVILIQAAASDPDAAAAIANTAADVFAENTRRLSTSEAQRYRQFVEQQLARTQNELQQARAKLRDQKQAAGVTSLEEQIKQRVATDQSVTQRLKETDADIAGIKVRIDLARKQLGELPETVTASTDSESSSDSESPTTTTTNSRTEATGATKQSGTSSAKTDDTREGSSGTRSDAWTSANQDTNSANQTATNREKASSAQTGNSTTDSNSTGTQTENASTTSTTTKTETGRTSSKAISANPNYQGLQAELLSLERELQALQTRRDSLAREVSGQHESSAAIVEKEAQLGDRELEVSLAQAQYAKLKADYAEAMLNEARSAQEIQIVDRAAPPLYPVRPIKVLYFGIGLLIGLFAGVLTAMALDAWLKTHNQGRSPAGAAPLDHNQPTRGQGTDNGASQVPPEPALTL